VRRDFARAANGLVFRTVEDQLGYDGLAQDRLGAQARSFISGYDVDMQSALDWPGGHLRAQRRGGRLAKTHRSTGKSFFRAVPEPIESGEIAKSGRI
jgi:hypothetical protein